ncbi:DNA starvation/stationary phase protection protein [Gammaproteobacteria bacterium]|nr:DNA starvation/stationary phase protection protein [Gammaproteobacteria bacterium]
MKTLKYSAVSIEALKHIVSDTYILAVKTQNAHWHLQGPSFIGVHQLLDEHYHHLIAAIDLLSERIMALGGDAPGSMQEMLEMTRLKEHAAPMVKLEDIVAELCSDHAQIRDLMLAHIPIMTEAGDEATADMLVERIREHDTDAWLLGSHIAD